MALNLAPVGNFQQFFDNSGITLSGGLLYTYLAGDTISTVTYINSLGTIPNANPIQLDSTGSPPQEIWITAGTSYKFVLTDKNGTVLGTLDNVTGINDVTLPSSITAGTVMIFQQQTVPVSWTRISAYDGNMLRVVGSATPGSGGTTDMLSRLVNQVSVDSHVVTTSEMPAHTHTKGFGNGSFGTGSTPGGLNKGDGTAPTLFETTDNGPGGNTGHVHTLTMALKYVDVMTCFKN